VKEYNEAINSIGNHNCSSIKKFLHLYYSNPLEELSVGEVAKRVECELCGAKFRSWQAGILAMYKAKMRKL